MLYKCCVNCKHWQGTKYSMMGLCQHFVGYIEPSLFELKSIHGWDFKVPFDPHDVKYFPEAQDALKSLFKTYGTYENMEVHMVKRKEQDIKYILSQYDGEVIGERIAPIDIYYLYTYWDMEGCGYFEETCSKRTDG